MRQIGPNGLVGGSSYRVLIAGRRAIPPIADSPRDFDVAATDEDRIDRPGDDEDRKYIPPAARDFVRRPLGDNESPE